MKKIASILLVIITSVIISSCEQAQTYIIPYKCELTHYYSRHSADLDKVKSYITRKGANAVGSSFRLSVYGKNEAVSIEEADSQAKVYFNSCTCFFYKSELDELLGEETEFEYAFCRINANDTIIVASYRHNMD